MPTKEEIRRKYGMTKADFAILKQPSLPTPGDLQKDGARLEKLGWWGNFEVWLKTTILGGVVLAVIFIGEVGHGLETIEKYAPIIYATGNHVVAFVSHYGQYANDKAIGFLVHTKRPPTKEDQQHQEWVIFSTGTEVYPVTGSWQPS